MGKNRFSCAFSIAVTLGFLILTSIIIYVIKLPLGGFQAQLDTSAWVTIPNGTNVLFDTTINNQSDNISYDSTTGEFTITKAGNYYISWSLSTDGAGSSQTISATIDVNGTSYSESSSAVVLGVLAGETMVTVKTTPTMITLVNSTGDDILLSNVPVQGNIVITELSK